MSETVCMHDLNLPPVEKKTQRNKNETDSDAQWQRERSLELQDQ